MVIAFSAQFKNEMPGKHFYIIEIDCHMKGCISLELQLAIDLLNKEEAAKLAKKLKNM